MKRITTVAVVLLSALNCIAQDKATITFDKQQYYIEEGESSEVCVEVKNIEFKTDTEEIFVVNASQNSSFLPLQSKSVPQVNGKYCFQLESNSPNGDIDYQSTNILEIQSASESISVGPVSSTTVVLIDDLSTQSAKDIPLLLIKGFDNDATSEYDFSLSLLATAPLVNGTSFTISNSNYSETVGWMPKNNHHEYIEIFWNGGYTIEEGTIICINAGVHSNSYFNGNVEDISILLNGEVSFEFTTIKLHDDSFLSSSSWSNIYILNEKINKYQNSSPLVYDGITYGIERDQFPFDIPFTNEDYQLFFGNQTDRFYAFINCSGISDFCDFIDFIKNINNWIYGEGTNQDELEIHEVCTDICDLGFCPIRQVQVNPLCYDINADVIFVVDESGSIVNAGEFEDVKSIVMSTSQTMNCLSDNLRFAVIGFSDANPGGYHIIQNFQGGDIDMDNYSPPLYRGTNVSHAYTMLLSDLDSDILDVRLGAELQVILLTDATYTAYHSFEPFNSLKSNPYNASHSVVYFEDSHPILSAQTAAAISSKGEPYEGQIANNSGDPEGEGGPRKLFIYQEIQPSIAESIPLLAHCNELIVDINPFSEIVNTQVFVSEGGTILSQTSESSFETNGTGTYDFVVMTGDNCEYISSFSFQENENCIEFFEPYTSGEKLIKGRSQSNHVLYEMNKSGGSLQDNFNVEIMPNPVIDLLSVYIHESIQEENPQYKYSIYAYDGKVVRGGSWFHLANSINVSSLTQGLYTMKIENSKGKSIIKKFVVVTY